jgi:hypothetical protein
MSFHPFNHMGDSFAKPSWFNDKIFKSQLSLARVTNIAKNQPNLT